MFRRRNPLPIHQRVTALLWPSRGWRRSVVYLFHRLGRLPGPPYRIAAGVACGAAVSFTPFMGFHFILAAMLALVMRGNIIASAIGTAVGNPWTFPLIWIWTYHVGLWMLGDSHEYPLPEQLSMHYIFDNFAHVFWPMSLGGLPTAVVAWVVVFWPAHALVLQYQRRRRRRLRRKVMKMKRGESGRVYAGQEAE